MRRTGHAVGALGIAGLLFASPAAGSHHEKAHEKASSEKGSEARGTGQAGESTGARSGEVTGAPGMAGGTSEKEKAAQSAADQQISGTVEKYDRQARTLSLSGSEKTLKITDDTQVLKDGERISPGQLMEGDEVRASYSGSGDEVDAALIEVTAGSGGSESAAPPALDGPASGAGGTGGSPGDTSAGSPSGSSTGSTGTKQP